MDYEDRKSQLLQILTRDLRHELFRRMHEFNSIGALKEWVREQLELETSWAETDKQSSRTRAIGMMVAQDDDLIDDGSEEPAEGDMEALMALTPESSPEEILAVQRRFGRFGSRPGGAPKGKGRGRAQRR